MRILLIDVGGAHVKMQATGRRNPVRFISGPTLTPEQMLTGVLKAVARWTYDAASIGYLGPVLHRRPVSDPHNLGSGWVGFNFETVFKRPVRLINDAAMQALGSYRCACPDSSPVEFAADAIRTEATAQATSQSGVRADATLTACRTRPSPSRRCWPLMPCI